MAYGIRVNFDPVREAAFGSVGAAYAAIGSAITDYPRMVSFNNTTDTDVYFSLDGVNNHMRIAAGSAKIFDFTANKARRAEGFFLERGTVFYQKRAAGAPTVGNLWIEVVFADGGT